MRPSQITFSVICVYNNRKILDKFLLSSLKKQTQKFQLILLGNTKNKYKSAAEALNFGAKKAKGKYLIFVHQDVELLDPKWLEKTDNYLERLSHLGIAGVAGMSEFGKENKDRGRSVISQGNPPEKWPWGNRINKPEIVQTLDECLLIIPRKVFKKIQFDEKNCDKWHLYGVDYCLNVKNLNFAVYVLPLPIYHFSIGTSFSNKYYLTLEKILKKHKKSFFEIYTTCGNWYTIIPVKMQLSIKSILHKIKKHNALYKFSTDAALLFIKSILKRIKGSSIQ